MGMASGKRNL